MSNVIIVKPVVKEEEIIRTVEKIIDDPLIKEQLNNLLQKREEILKQLDEIEKQIENLQKKLIKQEVVKVKKVVMYVICPKCNTQIKLVGKQFRGRIRCKCGTILLVQ